MMKNKKRHPVKGTKTHYKNTITNETRQEAYISRPVTRQADILRAMGEKEMSARQICKALGYTDMNAVRPRLTELCRDGKVEVVGKAKDKLTDRTVAIYRAV